MKLHLLSILLLCCCSCSFAQSPDSAVVMIYPANQVKIGPVKVVDVVNPGYEVGYERREGKSWSTFVAASWLNNGLGVAPYDEYSGYRLLLEQKYRFPIRPLGLWMYISGSLVYNSIDLTTESSFTDTNRYHTPVPVFSYNDTFSLHKTTFAVNGNFGIMAPLGRFTFDIVGGMGLKRKTVTHSNRINPDHVMLNPRHPNVYVISEREFDGITASLALALRIGFTF